MRARYGDEKDGHALIGDTGRAQERIGGPHIDYCLKGKNVRGLVAELVLLRNLLCNRHVRFEGGCVVLRAGSRQCRESRIRPENSWHARADDGTVISMIADDAVWERMAERRESEERLTAIAVFMGVIFENLQSMEDSGYRKWLVGELPGVRP